MINPPATTTPNASAWVATYDLPPHPRTGRARRGSGGYSRTPEEAERHAERLRGNGKTNVRVEPIPGEPLNIRP